MEIESNLRSFERSELERKYKYVHMSEFPMIFKTKDRRSVGASSDSRHFTKIRTDSAHPVASPRTG